MTYAPSYFYGDLIIYGARHDAYDVEAFYTARYAFYRGQRTPHDAKYWAEQEARYMFEREQEIRAEFGLKPLRDDLHEWMCDSLDHVIAEDEAMLKEFGFDGVEREQLAWELSREEHGWRVRA